MASKGESIEVSASDAQTEQGQDVSDGMQRNSPEFEIMMLLWGQKAKNVYDKLPKNMNFSKLPGNFWNDATEGMAKTYTEWVSSAINRRLKQLQKEISQHKFKELNKRFCALKKQVIEVRSSYANLNSGHRAALELWKRL